ncbi:uncharacterized protein LOC131013217 [Salvia miltiorrhiza]|uniref:uncharacterized protein LOC131013217 n=1 Tax=Salvia miltiorrhiza TaxID=226208 RepID=UPI0025AC9414|nr:uncharacterized protein LOC131013217 [Salvia miltiorrhiza]
MESSQVSLIGSTICLMVTLQLSIQLVSQHYLSWNNPKEQKAIVVIVLMAPLYAIDSYAGFIVVQGSSTFFTFLDSVKECYEALVMAKFLSLMYAYLNISISQNIVPDHIKGREIHHSFPITLFQPHTVRLDHKNLKLLKNWTWQFVVIRPVCSVLMIALQLLGVYPEWLSWTLTVILNVSVSLALYSLVLLHHVFAKELEAHKPLAKFLCIKGIVFFSFWQGMVLDVLVAMGILKSDKLGLDVEHLEEAVENVLVIVEMVFFSLLMRYAYPPQPYRTASLTQTDTNKTD